MPVDYEWRPFRDSGESTTGLFGGPGHDHLNPHQSQLLLLPLPVSVDNVVIGLVFRKAGYTSLKDEGEKYDSEVKVLKSGYSTI